MINGKGLFEGLLMVGGEIQFHGGIQDGNASSAMYTSYHGEGTARVYGALVYESRLMESLGQKWGRERASGQKGRIHL